MAHYDIFRDQLGIKYPAFGHALWEPNPGRLYTPVEVGDVGFIREGKFHRLFNALLPADHPSHERFGVPEHYEPLRPGVADHIDSGTLSPNDFCSFGVAVSSGGLEIFASEPVGIADVSFACTRKGGAVLSLPVTAQREDTIARGDSQNGSLSISTPGLPSLGVSGSWTNVAFFEGQSNARASFGVQITNDVSTRVNWQVSREHVQGAMLCQGPSGSDLPEDQCIFVRGYRVTRTLKLFPRLRGAADHSPDPSGPDCEPELEVVSFPSFTEYRDPLHVLLEYFAERASGCDFVLVHDDDLDRIRRIGDWTSLESLQPDGVVDYLQRSEPEITQVACDVGGAGGSMVAVFSEESRSWDSTTSSRDRIDPSPGGPSTSFYPVILKPRLAHHVLPWTKSNAQAKYIDLINEAAFRWANWDIPKVIQIGDFGVIDKKTGELKVEGNIFTHPEVKDIARDYPAFEVPETDQYQIHSRQVKKLDVQAGFGAGTPGVYFKGRWKFNNKRGAILLMHRPRLFCVPDGFFDKKFDLPILKSKVVVEQVHTCPGFFMYLSNKASEHVSVTLGSDMIPSKLIEQTLASPLWSADGITGISQRAYREGAAYTPLFRFRSLGGRHWRR